MARNIFNILALVRELRLGLPSPPQRQRRPIFPVEIGKGIDPAVNQASFWGLPYPYGYRYRSNRCVRQVRVETEFGWRWKRVWVCS